MAGGLKEFFGRFFGSVATAEAEPVDYSGYRIRPAPYPRGGEYQTCGVIEKAIGGELREHRFVRAETHPSRDQAIAFSIHKAKQLIDEQGDRLFNQG